MKIAPFWSVVDQKSEHNILENVWVYAPCSYDLRTGHKGHSSLGESVLPVSFTMENLEFHFCNLQKKFSGPDLHAEFCWIEFKSSVSKNRLIRYYNVLGSR